MYGEGCYFPYQPCDILNRHEHERLHRVFHPVPGGHHQQQSTRVQVTEIPSPAYALTFRKKMARNYQLGAPFSS
ncbi:hypothetical protein PsorP6_016168 [Peronosclerospora sorghi]|uniref:Uncharacterized protein n=1 Tax=Peronosclerospora sorghi TaxID=230839 RepID=A0ACC0VPX9_9STRA|nr:hypothetical protein PsorP6_016168 [Peronosclerospora sorghi]